MADTLVVELIEKQKDWLEPLADTLQSNVEAAFESGGEVGQKVQAVRARGAAHRTRDHSRCS
ncbi:MAG: hypothetical protein SGI92_06640 [Bryobacteraceae bacterium]|nr:hypothetical protein [Bryobacteraceae bacterium]